MKWNNVTGYVTYQTSLANIQSMLGISGLQPYERLELVPYSTYILKYLSDRLIIATSGGDSSIEVLVQEIISIAEFGENSIVLDNILSLLMELGIDNSPLVDNSNKCCCNQDVSLEGEIPYIQDRFVYCWAGTMSQLLTILRLTYGYLFSDDVSSCGENCCCSCRESCSNYDSWSSSSAPVYPYDENYDPSHYPQHPCKGGYNQCYR